MSEYAMKLPDVGEGVAEAEIVEWHVAVGDHVTEDDLIADVMSDKATVELPSPVSGVVRWIAGEVGDILAVGSPLIRIDVGAASPPEEDNGDDGGSEPSANTEPSVGNAPSDNTEPSVGSAPSDQEAARRPSLPPPSHRSGQHLAAPAVRSRASRLGIELDSLSGSGADGRVMHADLDEVLRATPPTSDAHPRRSTSDVPLDGRQPHEPGRSDEIDDIRITGLRRNIAERITASARRIPHFTYVDEIDVTELEHLRRELNADPSHERTKLSLLPFLMRAVVLAVRTHPEMNARFDDEASVVHRYGAVHLGIAVQTDRGLMVSVVKHAASLGLWESAEEVARLAEAARTAKITLDELNGSTITISSLGALGGVVSTPVINAPEVAIIGVNKIADRPVYVGDTVTRRKIMNLSSSFDHRVIDGADAAEFIQTIKRLLETPATLFIPGG